MEMGKRSPAHVAKPTNPSCQHHCALLCGSNDALHDQATTTTPTATRYTVQTIEPDGKTAESESVIVTLAFV